MKHEDPMVHVRMAPDLKERVREAADRWGRSMTEDICKRVEESLDREERTLGVAEPAPEYQTLNAQIDKLPVELQLAAIRLIEAANIGFSISTRPENGLKKMPLADRSRVQSKTRPRGKGTPDRGSQSGNGSDR